MRNGRGWRNLRERLENLENDSDTALVILYFRDGSRETFSDRHLLRLLGGAVNPESLLPGDQRKLDAISRCVRSVEPRGGQIVSLIRALQHGPV